MDIFRNSSEDSFEKSSMESFRNYSENTFIKITDHFFFKKFHHLCTDSYFVLKYLQCFFQNHSWGSLRKPSMDSSTNFSKVFFRNCSIDFFKKPCRDLLQNIFRVFFISSNIHSGISWENAQCPSEISLEIFPKKSPRISLAYLPCNPSKIVLWKPLEFFPWILSKIFHGFFH